jgi:multimeric flavodoxin WrbA
MPLKALALIGTLQKGNGLTNTVELVSDVLAQLEAYGIMGEKVRLANLDLPPGIEEQMSSTDEWPSLANKIREADIVLFATPIWWNQPSSLIQRVLERMTHFDENYIATGRSELYHKLAGVVVTGHEDGAQHIVGSIVGELTWFGFVIPPECATYWVGEVGGSMTNDPDKRRINAATKAMTAVMARNLANYATLLSKNSSQLKDFEHQHPARVGTRGGTYVNIRKMMMGEPT